MKSIFKLTAIVTVVMAISIAAGSSIKTNVRGCGYWELVSNPGVHVSLEEAVAECPGCEVLCATHYFANGTPSGMFLMKNT